MEPRFERLTPLHGGTSSYRVWRGLRSQGTVEGFPSAARMTAYWEARRPSGIAVMCPTCRQVMRFPTRKAAVEALSS